MSYSLTSTNKNEYPFFPYLILECSINNNFKYVKKTKFTRESSSAAINSSYVLGSNWMYTRFTIPAKRKFLASSKIGWSLLYSFSQLCCRKASDKIAIKLRFISWAGRPHHGSIGSFAVLLLWALTLCDVANIEYIEYFRIWRLAKFWLFGISIHLLAIFTYVVIEIKNNNDH